jgi:hypothetical protein
MASASISATCCEAGRRSRGLITRAGTLRCSVNGRPVQDRSPQRFTRAYKSLRALQGEPESLGQQREEIPVEVVHGPRLEVTVHVEESHHPPRRTSGAAT